MNAMHHVPCSGSLISDLRIPPRGLVLLVFGWLGCAALAFALDGAPSPILYGILAVDQSSYGATYRLANAEEWRQIRVMRRGVRVSATPNMQLLIGDRIRTGPKYAVTLRFPNGSELYLKPDSLIRIGSVFAFFGEMFVRVRGAFQVDTEFVTAGAEGTEWVMRVSEDGDIECTILEGRVRMVSKQNYWAPLSVPPNQRYVTHGLKDAEMKPASSKELDAMKQWIEQMDRVLQNDSYPTTPDARDPVLFPGARFYFAPPRRETEPGWKEETPSRFKSDRNDRPNPY